MGSIDHSSLFVGRQSGLDVQQPGSRSGQAADSTSSLDTKIKTAAQSIKSSIPDQSALFKTHSFSLLDAASTGVRAAADSIRALIVGAASFISFIDSKGVTDLAYTGGVSGWYGDSAGISTSSSGASIADIAAGLDMFSSALGTVASSIACFSKCVTARQINNLKKDLENADEKDKGAIQSKIANLEKQMGGKGLASMGLLLLANLSYLVGSISAVAPNLFQGAAPIVAPLFGSLVFGVFLIGSKTAALVNDIGKYKEIKNEIKDCEAQINNLKEGSPLKEIYQARIDSLKETIKKDTRLSMIQNSVDILVGCAAVVAGATALAGLAFAPYMLVPLAICLIASLTVKGGILSYQIHRNITNNPDNKDVIKKLNQAAAQLTFGHAQEKTVQEDSLRNDLGILAKFKGILDAGPYSTERDSKNSMELLTKVATRLNVLDGEGNPDSSQVTVADIASWAKGEGH